MKALLVLALVAVLHASASATAGDDAFEGLVEEYVDGLMRMDPELATITGDHRFDDRLTDRSRAAIAERLKFSKVFLQRLESIKPHELSAVNEVDFDILKANLESAVFSGEVLLEHEWNPLVYNTGGAIYSLIAREFAPLEERLRSVKSRLESVPDVVSAAQANLKNPPRVHTETAVRQNRGNISLVENSLDEFIAQVPSMREALAPARKRAVEALTAYGEWLEQELLPRSTGDFRLGDEKWRKKLRFSLHSDLSKEEILKRAETDLKQTQREMYETALPLHKVYFPEDGARRADIKHVCKAVLDKLAEDRPDNATIVEYARETLDASVSFAREHNLVTVPEEPVRLIVMPEFQRGVAIAYCDPPGALEKELDTFYAIAPTPEDWNAERTESFFREYNNYMLHNLTVHEAVPGHYLQLAHSNKFDAPTILRALFYSGSFVEGWAVYAEKLMADAGFGGPQVKMQQLKMRLRVIINSIIDQKIHTEGMTEDEAMAIMMDEGFQEDGEAAGKWRRACLTSTQLSTYFVGSAEVEDIVAAYQKKHKGASVKQMHDAILSYGSPPAKYIREHLGLN